MATLTVTSTPSGASVYVDGALIGPTPLHDYEIDTGLAREKQVTVGLELSGYKYRVENLALKGGKKTLVGGTFRKDTTNTKRNCPKQCHP